MSDALNKIADKLPDVYFDWYARLLPGCFGLLLVAYEQNYWPELSATLFFVWLFGGYLLGHILQPIAGFIVKRVETRFDNEDRYSKAKAAASVPPSLTAKVSKAHAEANSMLAFGIVFAPMIFVQHSWVNRGIAAVVVFYFLLASFGRIVARNRKINDLPYS